MPDPSNARDSPVSSPGIEEVGPWVTTERAYKTVTVWQDGRPLVVPLSQLEEIGYVSVGSPRAAGAEEAGDGEKEGAVVDERSGAEDSDLRVSVVASPDAEDQAEEEVEDASAEEDPREIAWMPRRTIGRRTSSSSLIESMRDSLPNLWDGDLDDSGARPPALSGANSPVLSVQESPSKKSSRHTTPELDRIARIMRGSKAEEDSSSDDDDDDDAYFDTGDVEEIVLL